MLPRSSMRPHLRLPSRLLTTRPSFQAPLMSFKANPPISQEPDRDTQPQQPHPHRHPDKALPAPGRVREGQGQSDGVTTLDVSGGAATVKLDALGSMVVNQDGTISRISNWARMSELERTSTLRIIGKRNQTRLAALRKAMEPPGVGQDGGRDDQNGPQA